jgi:hypothetical protein
MTNSNYSKSKTTKKKAKNLVLARTGLFYGLKYVKVKEEKISSNRGLTSTPNFLFYDNNTKVMIDFSDYYNTDSKEELSSFWNLLTTGMTFAVSDGDLIDSNSKTNYDVTGVYSFSNIEDSIIFANVVSTENISSNINLYKKQDFSNLPNFIFNTIIEPEKKEPITSIVNFLGKNTKNSFNFLGLKVGDYIQLQGKQNKFEVADYFLDSEGKEILKVYGEFAEEDRTTTKTFIGLYVEKKNEDTVDVDITDETLGSCEIIDNGIIISCTSNNTNGQCLLRKTPTTNVDFNAGIICIEEQQVITTTTDTLTTIVNQQTELISKLSAQVQSIPLTSFTNQPFR